VADLAGLEKILNDNKVPVFNRVGILGTLAKADFMQITAVHEADKRGDGGAALRRSEIGEVFGIQWYMSQNVPSVVVATSDDAYVVNGVNAVGATSVVVATGTGTMKEGNSFTIAGDDTVYAVKADYAGGAGSISINPPLQVVTSGAEALTDSTEGMKAHVANFAGHPNAITVALIAPAVPPSANGAVISNRGLSVRVVRDYTIASKKEVISLDMYAGAAAQQPELGMQIFG
jgi:hypothetical protein